MAATRNVVSRFFCRFAEAASRRYAMAIESPLALRLLWLGVVCSVVALGIFVAPPCDGSDYLAEIPKQAAYLSGQSKTSLAYSPVFVIPAIWIARLLPLGLTVTFYGVAYFSGWCTQLWAGMQCTTTQERNAARYIAPLLTFFPGLLISDAITAGNIAYILYGFVLAALAWAWKRESWLWFYVAVLGSACVKIQMLTLLAIPLISGRRHSMRAVATAAGALSLYALQSLLWPQSFHVYVNTLKVMSSSRRDFGCSPAGNVARVLWLKGIPHQVPAIIVYFVFATALCTLLWGLARLYQARRICFENWAPVMLIGVILLSPRIQSYDIAAVSLPMVLVVWRALRGDDGKLRKRSAIVVFAILLALSAFVEMNEAVVMLPDAWKYIEMLIILAVFGVGVRALLNEAGVESLNWLWNSWDAADSVVWDSTGS